MNALKNMHRAYGDMQNEIAKHREIITDLKRQIANRDIAHKLFNSRQIDSVMKVSNEAPFIKKKEK
jgi:hypothetical protein